MLICHGCSQREALHQLRHCILGAVGAQRLLHSCPLIGTQSLGRHEAGLQDRWRGDVAQSDLCIAQRGLGR